MDPKEKSFCKNLGHGGLDYLVSYINNNCNEITMRYLENKLNDDIITHEKLNLENVVSYLKDFNKFMKFYGDMPKNKLMPNLSSLKNEKVKSEIKNILISDVLGTAHAVYRDIFFKGVESFIFELKRKPNGNVSWAYLFHPEFGEYFGKYKKGNFMKYISRIEELMDEWFYFIEGGGRYPGVNDNYPNEFGVNNLEFKFIVDNYNDGYSVEKEDLHYIIKKLIYPEYIDTYTQERNLLYIDEGNFYDILDIYVGFLDLLIYYGEYKLDLSQAVEEELYKKFKIEKIKNNFSMKLLDHNKTLGG